MQVMYSGKKKRTIGINKTIQTTMRVMLSNMLMIFLGRKMKTIGMSITMYKIKHSKKRTIRLRILRFIIMMKS